MPALRRCMASLGLLIPSLITAGAYASSTFAPLDERGFRMVNAILDATGGAGGAQTQARDFPSIQIMQCSHYPGGGGRHQRPGREQLLTDLATGLETGLACLAGHGPMGRLHPYHEYQANRLLQLLEAPGVKTFQCVEDAMFATAVATAPGGTHIDDPLYPQLRDVKFPAVVLDTYRIGGMLSRRLDDDTYRTFFHLAEHQIYEHRNGQPLRLPSLHRYRDRGALLFHEMVHWLGHEHSATRPDLAHLYETCCFGGSDYIRDPASNRAYRDEACTILRDDELWSQAYLPYRQMRVWHHKGYDTLKSRMRDDFDD